jgi:nucleotide-binding universal stress UspA family protein
MTQHIHEVGEATSTRVGARPRVVVCVDDSPGSRAALLAALTAAARRGVDLDVVSAFPVVWPWASAAPVIVADLDAVLPHTGERTRAVLSEVMKEATEEGIDSVSTRVVAGGGPRRCVAGCRPTGRGSRGHGPVRELLLGSVALHCVMHAPCPVLVIHDRPDGSADPQAHRVEATAPVAG